MAGLTAAMSVILQKLFSLETEGQQCDVHMQGSCIAF
jgi:hypothetical protein